MIKHLDFGGDLVGQQPLNWSEPAASGTEEHEGAFPFPGVLGEPRSDLLCAQPDWNGGVDCRGWETGRNMINVKREEATEEKTQPNERANHN